MNLTLAPQKKRCEMAEKKKTRSKTGGGGEEKKRNHLVALLKEAV